MTTPITAAERLAVETTAAPHRARVLREVKALRRLAEGLHDEELRAQIVGAVNIIGGCVDRWANQHLDKVVAGESTMPRWLSLGAELSATVGSLFGECLVLRNADDSLGDAEGTEIVRLFCGTSAGATSPGEGT